MESTGRKGLEGGPMRCRGDTWESVSENEMEGGRWGGGGGGGGGAWLAGNAPGSGEAP